MCGSTRTVVVRAGRWHKRAMRLLYILDSLFTLYGVKLTDSLRSCQLLHNDRENHAIYPFHMFSQHTPSTYRFICRFPFDSLKNSLLHGAACLSVCVLSAVLHCDVISCQLDFACIIDLCSCVVILRLGLKQHVRTRMTQRISCCVRHV